MELDFGLGIGARSSAEQKHPPVAVTHRGGAAQPKAEATSTAIPMEKGRHHQARPSSPRSTVSSFSTVYTPAVKTENEFAGYEDNDGGAKKKLRLSKGQSALLEDKFKEHSTLSPKQKHALANQLNLQPRQVEVWFQNRRARTKVEQTKADCELLKKCCESLTEENRRLHKELHELQCSLKFGQMPVDALTTICPSCKTIAGAPQR